MREVPSGVDVAQEATSPRPERRRCPDGVGVVVSLLRLLWVATYVADTDVTGQGQTVTPGYDYRHGPVTLLTCTFATVMRMG